jgi:polar amino acid transport system substrate-binding protein
VLTRELKHASVVPVPSLQVAGQMLREHGLDAFATNKAILFELADQVPTARVLDGRWGLEHLAIAVPKGRQLAEPWLREFANAMQAEGLVKLASMRAGLRGTVDGAGPSNQ